MSLYRFLVANLAAASLIPTAVVASPGDPRPPAQRKTYLFNIPGQPLSAALEAFGIVTGHQVIYDSRVAAALQSSPVAGVLEPEAALRILLAGTDLTVRYTGPEDVAIIASAASRLRRRSYEMGPEAPDGTIAGRQPLEVGTLYVDVPRAPVDGARSADYTAYGRVLRIEIRRALDADQETTRRNYHVQFDVWIDRQGRIGRTETRRSSGQARLDREIRRVVARLVISQPPPSAMPQPVRITILSL